MEGSRGAARYGSELRGVAASVRTWRAPSRPVSPSSDRRRTPVARRRGVAASPWRGVASTCRRRGARWRPHELRRNRSRALLGDVISARNYGFVNGPARARARRTPESQPTSAAEYLKFRAEVTVASFGRSFTDCYTRQQTTQVPDSLIRKQCMEISSERTFQTKTTLKSLIDYSQLRYSVRYF